jgi:FMN phosphatase YigB (HAD superfamily)
MTNIKAIIFDWGDTIMRDFPDFNGPMANWPRVEAIAGVAGALEDLHHDFICCLASNAGDSDAELMGAALSRVNLSGYFHYLFTSHELGFKKPDPEFYLEIVRRTGVKLQQCIAIGNDYAKDIVPAKSVGMFTIWFCQAPPLSPAYSADCTVDSMDKLTAVLKESGILEG